MNPQALPLKPNLLPPEPGFWPLAPGWWILIALFLSLSVWLLGIWYQRRRRYAANRWLQQQLRLLNRQQLAAPAFASGARQLLKQWSLAQGASAALTGEAFIGFLQVRLTDPSQWSPALTHLLQTQAYQGHVSMDADALANAQRALQHFANHARPEQQRVQF